MLNQLIHKHKEVTLQFVQLYVQRNGDDKTIFQEELIETEATVTNTPGQKLIVIQHILLER